MAIERMKSYLLKWNPKWNKNKVINWSDKQIVAIYTKEKEKQKEKVKNMKDKLNFKQLSFF